jgi:hypothetical protein
VIIWFKSQFGETRCIAPVKPSFTGNTPASNDYFFEEQLDITPLWSESKISTFLNTVPILHVPVKPVAHKC